MTDVPDLPNFSRFHDVFRENPKGASNEGHMRPAFFMAYDEANCEFIKLASKEIDDRLKGGPELVSANFVIPYPPGFPIMVPGQVITTETITFMRKLDVKEIHGYQAAQGLKLLKPAALAGRKANGGQHDRVVVRDAAQYPEIAIFLSLALGYYFGRFTFKGIGLGSVTATLLAGVVIGQIGITIPSRSRRFPSSCSCSRSATGWGRSSSAASPRTACPRPCSRSSSACSACSSRSRSPRWPATISGYAAGFYAGRRRISAAMGLSTDAINRLGLAADQAKDLLESIPVAYAVTYMFGTVGSAIVIALLGPALLRIDLVAACKEYEEKHGGTKELGGAGSAWHQIRCARSACGRAARPWACGPPRPRRCSPTRGSSSSASAAADGTIEDATADTVIREGDVVAVVGARQVLVSLIGGRLRRSTTRSC